MVSMNFGGCLQVNNFLNLSMKFSLMISSCFSHI